MGLFGRKEKTCCSSMSTEDQEKVRMDGSKGARVKVLGAGCAKCQALERATEEALKELGMEVDIEHVRDFAEIASYGVMSTPALVIDGKLVSYGKVLKKDEVVEILKKTIEG